MTTTVKLTLLRQLFDKNGINAYLVPQTDIHQNEYLPECYRRIEWLTNFSGSAGTAIVSANAAAVFVDGRYTLQAAHEVDTTYIEIEDLSHSHICAFLTRTLSSGDVLGFDPWLITNNEYKRYTQVCAKLNVTFKPIADNLIDHIWNQRPSMPNEQLQIHKIEHTGLSSTQKLQKISQTLQSIGVDAAVLTQCESVAWLLNVRGRDIACTPVALAFGIVHVDQTVDLFIDANKVNAQIRQYLGESVRFYNYHDLGPRIRALAENSKIVAIDSARSPYELIRIIELAGGHFVDETDVCLLPKACKNSIEIEGARQAHIKDGTALVHLFAWLYDHINQAPIMELDVAAKLRQYRDEQGIVDISFNTITGSGPNGAIVHYRATAQSNRQLIKDELFLLDSGGQYLQGTTDVTRTFCMGQPSAEQKDRYTRVLKGHIQLACAKFPDGTTGHQLDAIARYNLWQAGLDYAHGTGHGVGSYLSVHEGPQRISNGGNSVALKPGMVISNEPGYYKQAEYGIRIENLVVVTPCPIQPHYEQEMLYFETITLVPIDKSLIQENMLTNQERQWLNDYHARVRQTIRPHLQNFAIKWFDAATEPL